MRSRAENISMVIVLVAVLIGAAWYFRGTIVGAVSAGSESTASPVSASPSVSTSAQASDAASPSPSPSSGATVIGPGSTVAFMGDSFAAGNGASTPDLRWTTLLAAGQQWTEQNSGHPQTGYVVAGSTGNCTPTTCPAFPDVATTLAGSGATLVIVSGGANDLAQDPAEVGTKVQATLAAIHTSLPEAIVVVVAPWWDLRPADDRLTAITTAIKDATAAGNATWMDVGQPIAGKSADFAADGFSPNDAGHAALAEAVRQGLSQAGLLAS
ncbi:MAG: SGNH/GDSL hydrolase family protein [Phycicoccus sp.]|nr:SGNH/GDSL hydrolase family protein [Phycicoccus sp.]